MPSMTHAAFTLFDQIYERDGYTCQYCGTTGLNAYYLIEHVVPEALGGPTEPYNLVVACRSCNVSKGRNIWAPNNLDVITADHPEWRQKILDAVTAAGGNSNRRAHARNARVTSFGVQARHDLRDAARLLAVKRKVTMGRLIEEAIIDLLRKYNEPVPEGD